MRTPFNGPGGNRNYAAPINGSRRSILGRLLKFVLKNYKFSLVVVAVCIVVTSLTTLASTLFTRLLIDDYIVPMTQVNNPQFQSLAQALFKLAIVLIFGAACSYAHSLLMIRVSQGTILRLRTAMFKHMQALPVKFFDSNSHGKIMSTYTNDVDTLNHMIQNIPNVLNSLVTITVTFVSMIVLSIPLTMVSIVMSVIMIIATTQLGKRSRRHFKGQQESIAQVNGYIEEMMTGQRVVKVFCHEDEAIEKFDDINEQLRSSTYNANRIGNIVMPVNGNLGHLGYVLIAIVGASLILGGHVDLSLGTLVAFLTLNKSFTRPIASVSQQINSILNASVGAERVFNILDQEPEVNNGKVTLVNAMQVGDFFIPVLQRTGTWAWRIFDKEKDEKPKFVKVEGGVEFDHVNFGYNDDKQILFDIMIKAMPDQKIAFVGGTGAGKTTITNLINRFYDIQEGTITYDGINVADISKHDLRRSLGMVLQETHLFTGTVMDNIRYGNLTATDQECIEAAKLVYADDFIRRLSNGYQTVLSGDGGNLSQGERQLLAIARAAIANPPVLILDEATSSIDTRTEMLVQRGMDSLMKGRTTFVIAHRLSTVKNADCIIVLEKGRIIEHGTHDELLALKGKYYQLYTGNEIT